MALWSKGDKEIEPGTINPEAREGGLYEKE